MATPSLIATLFADIANGRPVTREQVDRAVRQGEIKLYHAYPFHSAIRWNDAEIGPPALRAESTINLHLKRYIAGTASHSETLTQLMEAASAGHLGRGLARRKLLKLSLEKLEAIETMIPIVRTKPGREGLRTITRALSYVGEPGSGRSATKGLTMNMKGRAATPDVVVDWALALASDLTLDPVELARRTLAAHGFQEHIA